MPDRLELTIAGETMWLLADRALFWPREQLLLIADLHLGKADTFRSAGISVPSGGTAHDLARLASLLSLTAARRLLVLGDMLHGRADETRWRTTWDAWLSQHAHVRIGAIGGNHDRHLAALGLPIEIFADGRDEAPFALRHMPDSKTPLHVLCGHIHPIVRLPGMAGRWPAFVLDPRRTVLPAFSAFTGGVPVSNDSARRMAVCNGDAIVLLGR